MVKGLAIGCDHPPSFLVCGWRGDRYTSRPMAKDKRSNKNSPRRSKRGKGRPSLASQADRHDLYQRSVQAPETEVAFFRRAYKEAFGRAPHVLQEDFCGTAALCTEWVRGHKKRRAIGIDLDQPTLDWGSAHNLAALSASERARIELRCDDVRSLHDTRADVVVGCNFSYFIFRSRTELLRYFKAAYENLSERGVLVLDIMGGHLNLSDEHGEELRELDGFTYVWCQEFFDPLTYHTRFHIHFRFDDGSELAEAFTYDWRLWSVPEVRELLAEAGFAASHVYWEGTDEATLSGNGEFEKNDSPDNDPAFVAYIAAIKDAATVV